MSLKSLRKEKGFWDGGRGGFGTSKESGGLPSGFPGMAQRPDKRGLQIDLDDLPVRQPEASSKD